MSPNPVAVLEAIDVLVDFLHGGVRSDVPDEVQVILKEPGRNQADEKRERDGMTVQPSPEQRPFVGGFVAPRVLAKDGSKVRSGCHLVCTVAPRSAP